MDDEQEHPKESSGNNLSEILLAVLIAIFVLNLIVIICLLIFCFIKRRKRTRDESVVPANPTEYHTNEAFDEPYEHTQANPGIYTITNSDRNSRHPPSRPPRSVDVQAPPVRSEIDFYTRSLRHVTNNMYAANTNGGVYYPQSPRRDSLTSITATGSAASFDSGYLGSSPLVQYYGQKHRIKAKVHAADDQSLATSDFDPYVGVRKLTLSESRTISDV